MKYREETKLKDSSLKKRLVAFIIALTMIVNELPWSIILVHAKDDVGSTPTVTTTVKVDENNKDVIQSGDKFIIANGAEVRVTISVTAQNLQGSDELKGAWSSVKLGYFNKNNEFVDENLGYGGITARVVEDSSYWKDLDYVATFPDEEKDDIYTDSTKYFQGGELRLDFDASKEFKAGKTYSYTVAIKFMSETQENAVFTLKTYAGYKDWQIVKDDGNIETITDIDYKSIDTDASQAYFVNSNLRWDATVKILTGKNRDETAPVVWQKYNYQDVLLTMENISEKSTAYFDEFEFVFRLQYNNGIDGVVDEHMTEWFYNPDDPDNPIRNDNNSGVGGDYHYTGKYLHGGLLIYDVTGLSPEDYDDVDKLGAPLPYSYNTNGFGSVRITKEQGGTLYSKDAVEGDETKKSKKELLVKVPFANSFQFSASDDFVTVQNTWRPTVFFGTPQVSLSKDTLKPLQYFRKPNVDMSVVKTVQSDKMYVGKEAYYTISKITNKSNLPLFNPSVIDTLPASFDLTQLEYKVSKNEVEDFDTFQLSEIIDVNNPIEIEVEDQTTKDKKWISLGKVFEEDTEKSSASQKVWKIADIQSILSQYTVSGATQKFTHRIKINYAFDFADYESKGINLTNGDTVAGELYVYGIPQKTMTITNNADLYADYRYYTEFSEIHEAQWNKYEVGPYNSNVNKNVEAPQVWSVTQGLYDDGTNRVEGNPTTGTLNAKVNGYTVRFGVENESLLKNGKVTMEIPHSTNMPSPYIGLKVETIKITSDMLDKMDLREVVITTYTGAKYKFSASQVQQMVDANGDVTFKAEHWNTGGSNLDRPIKLEIYIDQLNESTTKVTPITDDPAFVEFLGDYEFPGTLTMNTKIESQYNDGEQTEVSHSSTGQLTFALPKMTIRTDGITESTSGWTEGDPVTGTLYRPTSGYRVKVSTTDSSISPGYVKIQLPATFEGEKIRITEEFLNNLKNVDGTESYTQLDIIGTKNEKVTLNPTQLDGLMNSKNELEIDKTVWLGDSAWQTGSRVKEVVIYFNIYQKDSNNFEDAYLEVVGKPMRVDGHTATGVVGTNYPASSSSNISKNDTGTINVPRPNMTIRTDAITETSTGWTEGDPVNGTLYRPTSGYRVKVGTSASSITPGYVKIQLPEPFESETIRITEEFLNNLKDYNGKVSYTSLEIVGTKNEKVTLTPTQLDGLIDSNNDLVIDKTTWLGNAAWQTGSRVKEVIIHFDMYQKDSGNFEDSYLEVVGKPMAVDAYLKDQYNNWYYQGHIATGTVGTDYSEYSNTNTSKSDNGTIHIPRPTMTIQTVGIEESTSGWTEKETAIGTLYASTSGYRVKVSTKDCAVSPGYVKLQLPATFEGEKIRITEEFLNNLKDYDDTVSYTSLEIIGTKNEKVTLTPTQLDGLIDSNKDLVIDKTTWQSDSAWQTDSRVKEVVIYFNNYRKDTSNLNDAYLEVVGKPMSIGNHGATGYVGTNYPTEYANRNTSTYDHGYVNVQRPSMTVQTVGIADSTSVWTEGDPVTGTLNQSTSGYRVKVSTTTSAITPGFTKISLPATFDSEKIRITEEFLNNLKDHDGNISYTSLKIIGTANETITLNPTQLSGFIDGNKDLVIDKTTWLGDSAWTTGSRVKEIVIYFDMYQKDTNNLNDAYLEVVGKPTRVGDSVATGYVGTNYPSTVGTNTNVSDNGTIRVPEPGLQIMSYGLVVADTGRQEGDPALGVVNSNNVGYTYRIGSSTQTRIEPGYLRVDLPAGSTTNNNFKASQITLSKDMLSHMKLDKVVIKSLDNQTTELKATDLGITWNPVAGTDYMSFTQDIVIPSTDWTGIANQVFVYFDYYEEKTGPTKGDSAYLEVLGTAFTQGRLTSRGYICTNYQDAGNPYNRSTYDDGLLEIEPVSPTIDALAHTTQTGVNVVHNIDEQHGKNIVVPSDWNTYYTYDIGNKAKNAKISQSVVTIDLNNKLRSPSNEVHGFKSEKLVIPADYMTRFGTDGGIAKIVVIDTLDSSLTPRSIELTMKDAKTDDDGNYYFDAAVWEAKGIQYPKTFELHFNSFLNDITAENDNLLRISLYGQTDWYTYTKNDNPADKHSSGRWDKLSTHATFESKGETTKNSAESDATQDVPIPKTSLSIDYQDYYEHQQGSEVNGMQSIESTDSVALVDGQRSYQVTPYERTFTQRYSLYQDSISTADSFFSKIDIPLNSSSASSEAKRGFHAQSIVVKPALFNDSLFKNFKMTIVDANDTSRKITITATSATSFDVVDVSGNKTVLTLDTENLELKNSYWESLGIEAVGQVYFEGTDFKSRLKNNDGDIFITGFSDSNFADGSNTGGHNDITRTSADTYLRNLSMKDPSNNEYPFVARRTDEGRHLVSKMYFDLQLETGFITAKDGDIRYRQTGISQEHVRKDYAGPGNSNGYNYTNYTDIASIEVGYKSLVSISADFRQYLYDYQNQSSLTMPNNSTNGHYADSDADLNANYAPDQPIKESPVDSDNKRYVKKYAYNTKTDLEITVNLPAQQGYEAYYLKIDPRAVIGENGQQFISKIEFFRKDGTSFSVNGSDLVKNAAKWNADPSDKTWYRVNLLTLDDSHRFDTADIYKDVNATNPYYRLPSEKMDEEKVVTHAVFTIKMNQKESFDGSTAAMPDFGNWVEDTTDMADQHMFEFVGRANKTGTLSPTATAKLTIGDREINAQGDQNARRSTDGKDIKTAKSSWSLENHYRQYYSVRHSDYYGNVWYTWHYNLLSYTAADLYSTSTIYVTERSSIDTKHGIEDSLYHRKSYNSYPVTHDAEYTTANRKVDYIYGRERPYNITMMRRANPGSHSGYDTTAYESYIDHAYFTDTMPPLKGEFTAEYGYQGFRPTKILLKQDLLKVAKTFKVTLKDGTEYIYTYDIIKNAETVTEGGIDYYRINVYYDDDPNMETAITNKRDTDIVLHGDSTDNNYITQLDIEVENINGDGDFASETHGLARNTYFENTADQKLIRLYGNVNVVNGKEANGTYDGVNRVQSFIKNDGGSQAALGTGVWSSHSPRPAMMKAFQIPLEASSTLASLETGKLWDYEINKENGTEVGNKPDVAYYSLNFKNEGETDLTAPGDTEKYDEATISKIDFTQSLPSDFRLTKITIPKELFKGDKFKVSTFVVNDGTANVNVEGKFVLNGDNYELDLAKLFKDGTLTRTTTTDSTMVAEKIISFRGVYEVTKNDITDLSNYLTAGKELLDGKDDLQFEGVWVDRTQEAIDNNVYDDTSTPTVGKVAYDYYSNERFPARTLKFSTAQFGTTDQIIEKNNLIDQVIYNRVSGLEMSQQRGTKIQVLDENGDPIDRNTLAYDEYYEAEENHSLVKTPVANGMLYPDDRIEHLITISSPGTIDEDIPLKNPVLRFTAPKGTRIVGWKFVGSSDKDNDTVSEDHKILDSSDLEATAYTSTSVDDVNQTSAILDSAKIYDLDDTKNKTNYKDLVIKPKGDHYLAVNGSYQVIVYLEMINEYDDLAFEGQSTTENIYASAQYRHNYASYFVFNRSSTSSNVRYGHDITGTLNTTALTRTPIVDANRDKVSELGVSGTSTLTYFKDTQKPSINITYASGEPTDYANVKLEIGNIANYPRHAQKNQVLDINFVKETGKGTGKRYFYLTERPVIKYVVSDSEKGKDGVYAETIDGVTRYYRLAKIYYKTTSGSLDQPSSIQGVTQGWTELSQSALTDPAAERAFLETIQQIRIVYEDVPAFLNDDGNTLVVMDNVILNGYAEHQEERTDVEHTANQNYSTMQINADESFIHVHEDDPLLETLAYRDHVATKEVYRTRPRLEIELQAFDSEEEANAKYIENPSHMKMGYRPGESFWYKMVVKNVQNNYSTPGNGALLNPIIYDKVPSEYLDFDGKEKGNYKVYLYNGDEDTPTDLTDQLYDSNAITSTKIQAEDIGGSQKLQYVDTAEGDAKPTDTVNNPTFNPSDPSKSTIEFTVYKFDFGKINMDLEGGYRLEIIYEVQAHEDHLPVIQWISDTKLAINGKNAYLPRFGEYSNDNWAKLYMDQNDVKNKMMDMDNLIHEFGVTGDLNNGTDPLEFLNGTVTYLPGASTNKKATGNWAHTTSDQTNKFFGDNINSSLKQKVTIGMANADDSGNYRYDMPSTDAVYAIYNSSASTYGTTFGRQLSRPRSYYTYLTSGRVTDTTTLVDSTDDTDNWLDAFEDETQQNIVWAQHNLHLQKSWLASATEMVSDTGAKYYDNGSDITNKRLANHGSGGYYDANYESVVLEDNHTPALEYTETYTSRLYASNYGDWDVNGTEFIYVFPKGARPNFNDDGTLDIKGYLYDGKTKTSVQHLNHNSTEMTNASEWKQFNSKDYESRIEYEILQNPDEMKDSDKAVLPSSSIVDVRRNKNGKEDRYDIGEVDGCWVIKITAHTTLGKWFNRGETPGYIMALDVPSVIYQDTMDGYWYDRLYVSPVDTKENSYCQIYDTDYQLSKVYSGVDAKEHFDIDIGGMNDYFRCTYTNGAKQPYSLFAPATMYINGFNVQNNRVSSEEDDFILTDENTQIANNGNKRYYSQSGNQAVAKKPFVRYWADVNERADTDKTSDVLDEKNFYIDVETEAFDINVNLENRYYAAEYPYGSYYGNPNSNVTYSYNLDDGGARGTVFAPVYTVVLPYGMMPINKDGKLFSETRDGTATNGINQDTDAVSWDIHLKQWNTSENAQGNNQRPHDVTSLLEEQNLTKDAFNVEVSFDQASKQYIVKFIPKQNDFDNVAKLFNEQIMQISIRAVAYDYAKNGPNAEEGSEDWDAIEVYLGSTHDVFRFTADNKLATPTKSNNNPYQVLARRLPSRNEANNFYSRFTVDPRLDSLRYVEVDRTWYYGNTGEYVGGFLGKTEVRDAEDASYRFPTKQRLYNEISLLADNTALVGILKKTADDSQDYADMNFDSHYMFTNEIDKQTLDEGAIIDSGVYNTVRLSGKHAILISEAKINDKRPDAADASPSLSSEDIKDPLNYTDNIWYSLEVKNRIPNTDADGLFDQDKSTNTKPYYRTDSSKTGAINHATFTYTAYLPDSLRYDDTYANDKDDKYADYYVELLDDSGTVLEKWNKDELKAHGWDVEVKSFPVDNSNPKGPQYVRALVVPAGKAGTDASNMYLPGNRVPGHLKNGEKLVIHLKTRVAETEVLSDEETWKEEGSEVYVNLHGLDGTKISIRDLKPVNPSDHPYSEQDIKTIEFENLLPDEPIRKDEGNDFDCDGDSLDKVPSEIYSYDTVGGFRIIQPDMTVRANTVRVRRILAPEPITGEIPSRDSVFRLAEKQEMVVNQSILNNGSVNRFVTQFNLPYRSRLLPSSTVAVAPDPRIKLEITQLTTGKWSVPEDAKYKEELDKNLRVYVYANSKNTSEDYQDITQDILDDPKSSWTLLNPGGARIDANVEVTLPDELKTDASQIVWVVQHKDDPEHYAVPKGFRLDVDADESTAEKEEINEVDPLLPYTGEGLHEFPFSQDVLDNSIRVSVLTDFVDNKADAQYLNFFTSAWAKYSDSKNGSLHPDEYRCGYQVSSELPVMDLYASTKYLKLTAGKYEWNNSLIFDLARSRIVKYKLELFNVNQELIDKYDIGEEEDVLSNPNITVALPYREPIVASNFHYLPFDANTGVDGTPLDDNYLTRDRNDLTKIQSNLQWTVYIMDYEGNKYPLNEAGVSPQNEEIRLSLKGEPYFNRKKVDSGNDRNTITFTFDGKLQPGQRIVIEYLASISDGLGSTNPEDMQAKCYAMKEGNFLSGRLPTYEDNGSGTLVEVPSQVGVKADKYDANNNKNINELVLELSSGAVSFAANTVVERRKRVSSNLNSTNVESTKPIPVEEGGVYTFTSGIQSLNNAGEPDYMAPVLFDVLPYKGDEVITGSYDAADGNYKVKKRNSQWNGWLIPSSVELYAYTLEKPGDANMKYSKIDPSEYDLYVGPIEKKADGSYQLKYDENGNPIMPSVNDRSMSLFYENINTNSANSVLNTDFVKLSDILNAPNSEELIKGIRTILVKMKNPAKHVVYGGGRYELKYSMQTPLNLPIFKGDILADTVPNEYQPYTGWNSMASAVINYNGATNPPLAGDGINYLIGDSNESGIFTDAPSKRGYIGDYIWYDENANGKQDEAKYERIINGSRNILSELTKDFDGDGKNDDPGINGVQLELLTVNGYPCNVDGQAIIANKENDKGGYFVIDETTGKYKLDIDGMRIWTSKGPVTTTTQSDYYGNKGYYIFANLEPGQYKVRMTLPKEYNNYTLTTPIVKGEEVKIYNPGDTLPKLDTAFDITCNEAEVTNLTFETGVINVEAVDLTSEEAFKKYDSEAVTLDIGIGHPSRYGGTVWNDASDLVAITNHHNGIKDAGEPVIPDVEVKAYEKGQSEVAIGMDGRPLITTTDSSGNYIFESLWPNKEYVFKIENTKIKGVTYKATPKTPSLNDPLAQDNDNDGMNEEADGKKIITVASFKTSYPTKDGLLELDEKDPTKVKLISTIDIGMVEPGTGSIGDYVWIDKNSNGIQDEGEDPYTEELELKLEPYYYDGDQKKWIPFEEDVFKKKFKNATTVTKSNETGFYSFVKLPGIYTIGYDIDDQVTDDENKAVRFESYVIGYKVKVDSLPEDYTYTSYKKGNDDNDNNLRSDGYLTNTNEYIIVASEDNIIKPSSTSIKVEFDVDGKTLTRFYQIDSNEFYTNYDIGLLKAEKGFVSGRVWDDKNRDGLQGNDKDGYNESAVQGVKVYLERLVIGENSYKDSIGLQDKEAWKAQSIIKVNDQGILLTNDIAPYKNSAIVKEPTSYEDGRYEVVAETVTDKNGEYRFENIENYSLAQPYSTDPKNIAIRYRIRIEKPLNTDFTIKDYNNDQYDKIDSDFGVYDATESPRYAISESFVLGQRLYEDENQTDHYGNKYDFTKNTKRTHVDAGLIVYPQYVELGNYVWKDTNEDGIQNNDEHGIPNVEVILYKFNPNIETKVYELDENNKAIGTKIVKGKWEECLDENGKVRKVKTDADGKYAFKVLAYDLDPDSEHYLQPNHYRVKITMNADIKWSPFKAGGDATLDSNGYCGGVLLDLIVKTNEELPDIDEEVKDDNSDESTGEDSSIVKNDLEESNSETPSEEVKSESLNLEVELNSEQKLDEETSEEESDDEKPDDSENDENKPEVSVPEFDKNGVNPFNSPVGNIFGITLDGNSIISDEFEIAKVYMEPEEKDAMEAILSVLVKMANGESSQSSTSAQCVTVEGSLEYFEDKEDTEDTTVNSEDTQDAAGEDVEVVKEREYIDFRSVHSDDTIDIGVAEKEDPEPEEPEDPTPDPIPEPDPEPEEPTPAPPNIIIEEDKPVLERTSYVRTSDTSKVEKYTWMTTMSGLMVLYLMILERKRG